MRKKYSTYQTESGEWRWRAVENGEEVESGPLQFFPDGHPLNDLPDAAAG